MEEYIKNELPARTPLGRKLRDARHSMRWTQTLLAQISDIKSAYISMIERGHMVPTIEMCGALEGALALAAGDLAGLLELEDPVEDRAAELPLFSTDYLTGDTILRVLRRWNPEGRDQLVARLELLKTKNDLLATRVQLPSGLMDRLKKWNLLMEYER
jgi:transcriptional regulator with XRE-family HTH domain